MKTTKEAVIKATSDLADEKGLNNVSLKAVAQKLNIRTPSLYNHIESLIKSSPTFPPTSRPVEKSVTHG